MEPMTPRHVKLYTLAQCEQQTPCDYHLVMATVFSDFTQRLADEGMAILPIADLMPDVTVITSPIKNRRHNEKDELRRYQEKVLDGLARCEAHGEIKCTICFGI